MFVFGCHHSQYQYSGNVFIGNDGARDAGIDGFYEFVIFVVDGNGVDRLIVFQEAEIWYTHQFLHYQKTDDCAAQCAEN